MAMVIDFHTHIFPPRVKSDRERYLKLDPCFAELYSSPKARLATAEELIESMDSASVDVSVILNLGWARHELCVETNDYLLESAARFPKRLIAFCSVQPASGKALDEVERCARGGARGIGELRPDRQGFDIASPKAMRPFAEALVKLKLVLLLHTSEPVGHDYPGKGKVTPEKVYPFIKAFPEVRTVFAHWGGGLPFYGLMPKVKAAIANVYFDTAASPYLYSKDIYAHVCQILGAEHVLFGSDWPLMAQDRVLKEIAEAGLSDEERNRIIGGNARRLLGLGEDPP